MGGILAGASGMRGASDAGDWWGSRPLPEWLILTMLCLSIGWLLYVVVGTLLASRGAEDA